jgi:5'-3' exonuclease
MTYNGWKCEILENIAEMVQKTEANSVVLCQEGKKNWRYEVFPDYKSNRKEAKAKSKLDFDTFYPIADEFCDKLRRYVPNIYQLKVEGSEGDDLIAILTKYLTPKNEVVCISTDRDFYQLLKYDGYKQYNPIKRQYVHVVNPERYLLEKIVVGDKGDGIPHVKPKVSVKTAASIVESGLEDWLSREDEQIRANFERNKKLIDFDCIPVPVQQKVIEEFKKLRFSSMSMRDMTQFLFAVGLGNQFDKVPEYANTFIKLERIDG